MSIDDLYGTLIFYLGAPSPVFVRALVSSLLIDSEVSLFCEGESLSEAWQLPKLFDFLLIESTIGLTLNIELRFLSLLV